jgi:predicted amidophosphoribosyltransferase
MQNAFAAKNPELISGKDIVILDDVTTTGATLHAAKAALLPHGAASITLIALAH